MSFTIEALNERIAARAGASPDESYTAKLLSEGVERCAKKFGEEAAEIIIAAVTKDKKATEAEASDVIYHLLVLLRAAGVPLEDVMAQLERRTAQSGLAEKAARGAGQ
jgi:phosphoribosyl-ATP pyrophosphohydrolase